MTLCFNLIIFFQGVSSTQSAESSFRAFKHYLKCEFGQKTPALAEMIPVMLKVFDKRYTLRVQEGDNKRVKIFHNNPLYYKALDDASYKLNCGGMELFHETLKQMEQRQQ